MRTWIILVVALTALGAGCGDGGSVDPAPAQESEIGTLQLSLRGVDQSMRVYRLRNATFDVQGTRFTDFQFVASTVSSDADLDSAVARTALVYGSYSVSLRPETWYIERIAPSGVVETVPGAVLLSNPAQQFFVDQGGVSRVTFQFGVDGQLVDFFGGELQIGIEVRSAADAGTPEGPL